MKRRTPDDPPHDPGTDPWSLEGEDSVARRCAAGEESAWELVHGYLLAVCRRICRSGESAEDLSSSVTLRLIQGGLRQVKATGALRGYLRRAALCAVIDYRRSPRSREQSLDAPTGASSDRPPHVVEIEDPGPSLEQGMLGRQVREIIESVLADLPGECGDLLDAYFRYKMGLIGDYRELSRILGRPIGSISVQVKRCLTRFREDPRAEVLAGAMSQGRQM